MAPKIDLDLDYLISLYIDPDKQLPVAKSQCLHRIHIIRDIWAIPAGSKILEIGPGQGDCTLVLAAAVGEHGHVDAARPGPSAKPKQPSPPGPSAHASPSSQADPLAHLASTSTVYDYVVLFHCLWYFDSPARIAALFAALAPKTRVRNILVAEWALEAKLPAQVPHVLAALARANLEVHHPASEANVRTAVSPAWLRGCLEGLGVGVRSEEMVLPPEGLLDGIWEVGSVLKEGFVGDVRRWCGDGRQAVAVLGIRDAVVTAVEGLVGGLEGVQSMQVWAAKF
ncbi:hypothetical protein MMC18_005542 [Xylographa bjoerkii]|nr:hypothetical protein [Xylographa bjoerkii]